jgi:hypothetical protein
VARRRAPPRRRQALSIPTSPVIRNVKLDRFTLDRMITILGKLDQEVEVSIEMEPRSHNNLVPA